MHADHDRGGRDGLGPRIGIGWRVLVFVVLFQAAQVGARLLHRLGDAIDQGAFIGATAEAIVRAGGVVAVTWGMCRWVDRRKFGELALQRRGVGWLPVGFVLAGLVLGGTFALELALGWARVSAFDTDTRSLASTVAFLVSQTLLFLAVGIAEETAFTGYLFVTFSERWGARVGMLMTAALFSTMHFPLPHFGPPAALALFVFSILMVMSRLLTGSIWLAVGWHAAWDLFQTAALGLSVEPGDRTLVSIETTGPALFVGTPPVIEGGVLVGGWLALCLAAGFALLRVRGPRAVPVD